MATDRLTGDLDRVDTPEAAFDFLVGLLLTHGQRADRAWGGPAELKRRLGVAVTLLAHELDAPSLGTALARSPAIARFPRRTAEAIERLAGYLRTVHGSDARRIWAEASAEEARARLRSVPGFDNKRAVVAIYLLTRQFGVFDETEGVARAAARACPKLGASA